MRRIDYGLRGRSGFRTALGRPLMGMLIWTFLIYWLVAFVGCFVIVEIAQDQLYDQLTPHAGLKVSLAAVVLAALMTFFHPSFESMFTTNIVYTIFQGMVWSLVFMLILQFHPWHALGLGVATMLLVSGLATMGVDGMLKPSPSVVRKPAGTVSRPVRGSLNAPPPTTTTAAPATAAPTPAKPAPTAPSAGSKRE